MPLRHKVVGQRFKRMLGEITPYLTHRRASLDFWTFSLGKDHNAAFGKTISRGFAWDPSQWPVWFARECVLPVLQGDECLWFRSWFGGESSIFIDRRPFGTINLYHQETDISTLADGKPHDIEVQTVPFGLFGSPQKDCCYTQSLLVWKHHSIIEAYTTFQTAIELLEDASDAHLKHELRECLEKAFSMVTIPRDTQTYFQGVRDNPTLAPKATSVWKTPDYPEGAVLQAWPQVQTGLRNGARFLRERMDQLARIHTHPGSIWAIGHAHIDYAWLWPESETHRKIVRTFSNAIGLMRKYPEFVFAQSSAQMYQDLLDMHPDLFESIQQKVRQGQWELVGGMWVESDCIIPSAESLIRQFIYGQSFFSRHFEKKAIIGWLPDAFGFSWILPQILQQAGIQLFLTTKLNWNDTNPFPYDLCRWRGIDGSEVIYHSFNNPTQGYNGHMDVYGLSKTWDHYHQKDVFPHTIYTYGYGDGGGGPTEEMIQTYRQLASAPGIPKIQMSSAEAYQDALMKEELIQKLPIWDGELYLEIHRGTLTSQAQTKRLHKQAEEGLVLWETMALHNPTSPYPTQEIDRAWKCLLKHEFHDILPGSSIHEVYKQSNKELQTIVDQAVQGIQAVVKDNLQANHSASVINPSPWPQKPFLQWQGEPIVLKNQRGTSLKRQVLDDITVLYWGEEKIPAFHTESFSVEQSDKPSVKSLGEGERTEALIMKNDSLEVEVLGDGSIQMVFLPLNRTVFRESGNLLMMYSDVPCSGDAWNIHRSHLKHGQRIRSRSIQWVHTGPIQWVIRVDYQIDHTTIVQEYVLRHGSDRLDVHTQIDWAHRRTLLRALFPTTVLSRKARYDLSAGFIERPTHQNTPWEKAQYEVASHRWCDLSQRDFGVAILNDGLYGHSARRNELGLTLVKSGVYPDFFADEGTHQFSYSIFPHKGEDLMPVMLEAYALNHPLHLFPGTARVHWGIRRISDPNLRILAWKKGKRGGAVLRLAEMIGAQGIATIDFSSPWQSISKTTILEERAQVLVNQSDSLSVEYRPFEIITLVMREQE